MQAYDTCRSEGNSALKRPVASEEGFSLIELLVVVIIIGILATIAIPTYLGQQEQARSAAVQTDLRNAGTAATLCYAKANGSYTGCGDADDAGQLSFAPNADNFGFRQSEGVEFTDPVIGTNSWSVTARYGDSGPAFKYDTATGRVGPV